MSWQDIEAKIVLAGVPGTPAGVSQIVFNSTDSSLLAMVKGVLQSLYSVPAVAALLDKLANGGPYLYIGAPADGGAGSGGGTQSLSWTALGVDQAKISNGRFFNNEGKLVADDYRIVIAHELMHALGPEPDPENGNGTDATQNADGNYIYNGPAIDLQNIVADFLGLERQNNYYSGTATDQVNFSEFIEGVSYSEGNRVDIVRFTRSSGDAILDMSARTDSSSDLLITFGGNDTLAGGGGNDYLYGGIGQDRLIGGSGNDLLYGGTFGKPVVVEVDTADYSQESLIVPAVAGIVFNGDFTSSTTYDGQRVLTVTDGSGGLDRLVSIERITGTQFVDTFKFSGVLDTGLDLTIDAKGSAIGPKDVLDLSGSANGFIVLQPDDKLSIEAQSGGGRAFVTNYFGNILGTAHSDTLISSRAGQISGGEGADYLGGGSDTTVLGGGGSDRVVGGGILDGGAGDDWYEGLGEDNVILFRAGAGHDVLTDSYNTIIDIGSLGASELKIAWEKTLVRHEDYEAEYNGRTDHPFMSDLWTGRWALQLPSGDTLYIGGEATACYDTGLYRDHPDVEPGDVGGWTNVEWTLPAVIIRTANGDITLDELMELLGLAEDGAMIEGPNGSTASASWFDANETWATEYSGRSIDTVGPTTDATDGDDIFLGGAMGDAVSYAGALAGVAVDLARAGFQATGGSGSDLLIDIRGLIGSAFNDTLSGTMDGSRLEGMDGDDVLNGRDGTDILYGGAGNDVLNGGAGVNNLVGGSGVDELHGGDDTDAASYEFAAAGVVVDLDLGVASDDGDGAHDILSSIEDVSGSDFNDVLRGDEASNSLGGYLGADHLLGRGGNDYLTGGAGDANILEGGTGDDTYYVEASDLIVEMADEGHDLVETTLPEIVLGEHLEDLIYVSDGDFIGVGNDASNAITSSYGNDLLTGLGGDDDLDGGWGENDIAIYRGVAADYTIEDLGDGRWRISDLVSGRDGSDTLTRIESVQFSDGLLALAPAPAGPSGANPADPCGFMTAEETAALISSIRGVAMSSFVDHYLH